MTFILLIGSAAYAQEENSSCEFGAFQVIKVIFARSLRMYIKQKKSSSYCINLFINHSNSNRVERPPKNTMLIGGGGHFDCQYGVN